MAKARPTKSTGSKSVALNRAKTNVGLRGASMKAASRRNASHARHFSSKSSNHCYAVEDCPDSSGQAKMTDAKLQHAYYAMIVKSHYSDDWRYVSASPSGLGVTHTPVLYCASSLDKLKDLWERVVLHNAIPWNDSVQPQTLRIIAYSIDIEEVTSNVFGEDFKDKRQTAALMMIADQDARLLGLEHAKAKQVLFHNPEYEDSDEHLLRQLDKESTSHRLENLMVLD